MAIVKRRLTELVLANKGSQEPKYLPPDDKSAGFLQLIVPTTSQSGKKRAYFYCRTVRDKKIGKKLLDKLKQDLEESDAKSVEVTGVTTKSVEERRDLLNIAQCDLVASNLQQVDLTTIPCEVQTVAPTVQCKVHTVSGGLRFCGQIFQEQVEITEVGKPVNHGGKDVPKKRQNEAQAAGAKRARGRHDERGSGDSGEETDDGTSDESVENEIGVLALFERHAQRRREEAAGAQHATVEELCTFVQGLSLNFGDQASVYAATMKEQAIDGEALLGLSAADLEELKVSLEHRSLLLARMRANLLRTRSTAP